MKVGTRGQSIGVNNRLKTIVSLVDRRVPIPLPSLRRQTPDQTPVCPFLRLPGTHKSEISQDNSGLHPTTEKSTDVLAMILQVFDQWTPFVC